MPAGFALIPKTVPAGLFARAGKTTTLMLSADSPWAFAAVSRGGGSPSAGVSAPAWSPRRKGVRAPRRPNRCVPQARTTHPTKTNQEAKSARRVATRTMPKIESPTPSAISARARRSSSPTTRRLEVGSCGTIRRSLGDPTL